MAKLSKRYLDPKDFGHYINNLWSVFTLIDSKEEIRSLFKDLFTHTEYKMFAKRLEIARRLIEGQTYEQISQNLKVTQHTIATVSNNLARGGDGLKIAHQRLKELESSYQQKRHAYQNYLERKTMPKFREQIFVKNLAKEGFKKINRALRKRTRETTAKKQLQV